MCSRRVACTVCTVLHCLQLLFWFVNHNFSNFLSQPLASKLNVLRSKIAANLKLIHISRGQEKNFSTLGPKLRESKAQQDSGDKQRQIRIEVIDYVGGPCFFLVWT